jgi:hypothetical protein
VWRAKRGFAFSEAGSHCTCTTTHTAQKEASGYSSMIHSQESESTPHGLCVELILGCFAGDVDGYTDGGQHETCRKETHAELAEGCEHPVVTADPEILLEVALGVIGVTHRHASPGCGGHKKVGQETVELEVNEDRDRHGDVSSSEAGGRSAGGSLPREDPKCITPTASTTDKLA